MNRVLLFIIGVLFLSACNRDENIQLQDKVSQLEQDNKFYKSRNEVLEKDIKYLREELVKYMPVDNSQSSFTARLANAAAEASKSYAYSKITYYVDYSHHPNATEKDRSKNLYSISDITEFSSWSEDEKYRFLDNSVKALQKKYPDNHLKIVEREAYNFQAYADASKSFAEATK